MTCRNCGAGLDAPFCGACGQRAIDPDPTLRELLHEMAEELLHWDGKLAATFRLLVTRPGALTLEYLAGRRIAFISPLRLYLTCSVLYFFVAAFVPSPLRITTTYRGANGTVQVGIDTTSTFAQMDTLGQHGRWVGRVWAKHFENAIRNRTRFTESIRAATPKLMFVLVPLFAALVALVYRSRRRRYPQHLAFALHVHAFLFLILTVMLVRRVTQGLPLQALAALGGFFVIVAYFVMALRRVYGGSWRGAVARGALIAATYSVAFLMTMMVTVGAIVLTQF